MTFFRAFYLRNLLLSIILFSSQSWAAEPELGPDSLQPSAQRVAETDENIFGKWKIKKSGSSTGRAFFKNLVLREWNGNAELVAENWIDQGNFKKWIPISMTLKFQEENLLVGTTRFQIPIELRDRNSSHGAPQSGKCPMNIEVKVFLQRDHLKRPTQFTIEDNHQLVQPTPHQECNELYLQPRTHVIYEREPLSYCFCSFGFMERPGQKPGTQKQLEGYESICLMKFNKSSGKYECEEILAKTPGFFSLRFCDKLAKEKKVIEKCPNNEAKN